MKKLKYILHQSNRKYFNLNCFELAAGKAAAIALLFLVMLYKPAYAAPYINLQLTYDLKTVSYNAERVYLEINGERLDNESLPMEPIIMDGSTLVPAREVFEKLGASVAWKSDKSEVDILYNNIFVVMHIDSNTAVVAGKTKTMTAPPKIINSKTMIPLRFCAEVIGLEVNWNESTRVIQINDRPAAEETTAETAKEQTSESIPIMDDYETDGSVEKTDAEVEASREITNISLTSSDGLDVIKFKGSNLKADSSFITSDTMVLNFPNTSLSAVEAIKSGQYFNSFSYEYLSDNSVQATIVFSDTDVVHSISSASDGLKLSMFKSTLSGIKYDYDEKCIQIPKSSISVDLSSIEENDDYNNLLYEITFNNDLSGIIGMGTLTVEDDYISSINILSDDGKTKLQINEKQIIGCKISEDDIFININVGTPKEIYKNVVVLDPGHGGDKPGAIGNGLVEKDLTLSICEKIIALFEENPDIKLYATRTTDVNPDFPERTGLANDIADIFISVHINSATATTASGTEVYYYDLHTNEAGLTSLILAEEIQNNLIANLGSVDRGVKTDNLYVTRYTTVPSVLCEIGFISNPLEASKMASSSYQQSAAKAIYDACVSVFEKYPSPR